MKPLGYVVIASLLASVIYITLSIWRDVKQSRWSRGAIGIVGLPGVLLMFYTMVRAAFSMPTSY